MSAREHPIGVGGLTRETLGARNAMSTSTLYRVGQAAREDFDEDEPGS